MANYIKYEVENNIGLLTICREEALNALNSDVLSELDAAIDVVAADKSVLALIITGAGRSFVAGADIGEQSVLDAESGLLWGQKGSQIMMKIETLPMPTIAAVNGFALGGGCELALACDLIIANEKAKFGQPEVSLGITPGFSGTQRLTRRVGIGKARELIFTGKMIKAQEAKEIGLVNEVTSVEELMDQAMDMAASIVKNAPAAVRYSKKAINQGAETDINTGIKIENALFALCFGTKDQKEGMQAFLDKRKPEFVNQ